MHLQVSSVAGHHSIKRLVNDISQLQRLQHNRMSGQRVVAINSEIEHVRPLGERLVPNWHAHRHGYAIQAAHAIVLVIDILRHHSPVLGLLGKDVHLITDEAITLGSDNGHIAIRNFLIGLVFALPSVKRKILLAIHLIKQHVVGLYFKDARTSAGKLGVAGRNHLHMGDVVTQVAERLFVHISIRRPIRVKLVSAIVIKRDCCSQFVLIFLGHNTIGGRCHGTLVAIAIHGNGPHHGGGADGNSHIIIKSALRGRL